MVIEEGIKIDSDCIGPRLKPVTAHGKLQQIHIPENKIEKRVTGFKFRVVYSTISIGNKYFSFLFFFCNWKISRLITIGETKGTQDGYVVLNLFHESLSSSANRLHGYNSHAFLS